LRKTYGEGFATHIRGDAHLSTLLERDGCKTLDEYRRKHKN
jgi:hypothetical protein